VLVELGAGLYPLGYLHARRRQQPEVKPLLVIALARPEHLAPAHFVVGVDEFVLPPYATDEVLARLQLALWRQKRIDAEHIVRIGGLTIDLAQRQVRIEGKPIDLSGREYELLTFLASNRSRPFSRDALVRHVWGYAFDGEDRVVDRYISRLRDKLGEPYGSAIETVRGLGYRLVAALNPQGSSHRGGTPAPSVT
jgi:DNA-binding response OmpR family regulator